MLTLISELTPPSRLKSHSRSQAAKAASEGRDQQLLIPSLCLSKGTTHHIMMLALHLGNSVPQIEHMGLTVEILLCTLLLTAKELVASAPTL
jgi:hypothetical protein